MKLWTGGGRGQGSGKGRGARRRTRSSGDTTRGEARRESKGGEGRLQQHDKGREEGMRRGVRREGGLGHDYYLRLLGAKTGGEGRG